MFFVLDIYQDATLNGNNVVQLNPISSYPNGWIGVCESQYLKDHEIKRVELCGHRIILLRSSSSSRKPYALDAYCPHLGADLSVGGKLIKEDCQSDCIRCPFHGWSFRVIDGQCVDVPYTKDRSELIAIIIKSFDLSDEMRDYNFYRYFHDLEPPNGVKIKTWECLETNGTIYVWHHTEGKVLTIVWIVF